MFLYYFIEAFLDEMVKSRNIEPAQLASSGTTELLVSNNF